MPVSPTFENVKESSYYYNGKLSIGAYVINNQVILMDSGIDDDTARKLENEFKAKGWKLSAIINTHSHADHCGGNARLQKNHKGLKVYSSEFEKVFIEDPSLEPTCFCGGAAPFEELKNKFLQAKPSKVTHPLSRYADQTVDIDGQKFEFVTLPGHTPGMIGVITPDNIMYCGDAIFAGETFDKHGVLFYMDIEKSLQSLNKLVALANKVEMFVLYHGGKVPSKDLAALADSHMQKIASRCDFIEKKLQEGGHSIDSLTQVISKEYGILKSVMQFTLTRACVNAYITYLQKQGRIKLDMEDDLLVVKGELQNKDCNNNQPTVTLSNAPVSLQESSVSKQFENFQISDDAKITIQFKADKHLTGEMHMDADILNSVTLLTDALKREGLVTNDQTPVFGGGECTKSYSGSSLKYSPRFGAINNKPNAVKISKIILNQQDLEISFENASGEKLKEIATSLQKMGLKDLCVQSNQALKI